MSDLHHTTPLAPPPSLVLHTAVDFVHKQGIGIGIVQRTPIGAARNNTIPITKRKYSVKGSQFTSENVKTPKRAYMFAIILAMGLARGTIKRRCTKTLNIRKVTVLSEDVLEIRSKETMRAKILARQKGRKACRSRCQAQHNAFIEAITDVN
ncbi:hypothetical protein SNOG_04969 [Parastagonospora nodorum SN15]|uniref:Uncharacterized protein n=1 Tax=Phaeosphaeria nodorum (strain SN15 / ATCC MYA-4574 / FGSC 10173) TaxID=321614 RepID=Q0UTE5_PHANO|nr:hypothetical protein SNOG_04969 [Parastagonospora nodorum SN15]EAT87360.1 hypothetical protein SNOG_04969 [Parastagonospora nodorum SN15]